MAELLADVRHYCDAHGLAYHELDRKAHGFYVTERGHARDQGERDSFSDRRAPGAASA